MDADATIQVYENLRDRELRTRGILVAEGGFLAERMLRSACRPLSVLCVPEQEERFLGLAAGRCPVLVRSAEQISGLAGFPFHRGVLGCAVRPPLLPVSSLLPPRDEARQLLLLVCPGSGDEANLGAMIRSAVAFGAGILLGPAGGDPFSRRSLRLSMGASLVARIARYERDDSVAGALREAGFFVWGTANRPDAVPLDEVAAGQRCAAVIGHEGTGLEAAWIARCDALLRIPVCPEIDSLNAAVAAGIVLYALSRAKG